LYRVHVKVCGITNIVDARMVERAGVDAIGFIFWPQSPRVIKLSRVGEITRILSPFTTKIGVFNDAGASEVEKTMRRSGLTAAQIYGKPSGNDWRKTARRTHLILVVSVNEEPLPEEPPWPFCSDYLFDPGGEELPGALGKPFDWSLLPDNSDEMWGRIYVSGGLTADNVGRLIKEHRPYCVDVCDAVEGENYRKDLKLVREFMAAVREAEYEVNKNLEDADGEGNDSENAKGNST